MTPFEGRIVNRQYANWFAAGKLIEALIGDGDFFVPDVTYRDQHDTVLALGQLLQWMEAGHRDEGIEAFNATVEHLLKSGRLSNAIGLLRTYAVFPREVIGMLSIDVGRLRGPLEAAVLINQEALTQDEELRDLLLLVARDFEWVREAIALRSGF